MQAALGSTEEIYRTRLSAEVEKLAGVDIFGQYTPEAMDKIQELQVAEQIEEYTPSLFELLDILCRTTNKTVQRNRRRIASILSIICFTRYLMKCNFLPAIIGLLLHFSGAKRQVYRLTNSFDWTESYYSVLRSVDGLMNKARAFIESRKENPWAIVYDNCDLSIGVSDQSDTKKNELISITTGLLIPGRCHPVGGIKQSDFHPEMEWVTYFASLTTLRCNESHSRFSSLLRSSTRRFVRPFPGTNSRKATSAETRMCV